MKFIKSSARFLHHTAMAALLCALAVLAHANPTAPKVVQGSATFSNTGNILNVTNSHNAVINWGSFAIGVNELTRFIQPSQLSAVLNRVNGQDPRVILGALQSNGRVLLINRNGIIFSTTGQINVSALVTSHLVLAGKSVQTPMASVVGSGAIGAFSTAAAESGSGIYMAGDVQHVTAGADGVVTLAAGRSIELVDPATPRLRVEVAAPADRARDLGRIVAAADRSGIHAGLIREGDTVNADRVVSGADGSLMLKAGGDSLSASSRVAAAR
jgi:filamentous hemagglutinin family protein